MQEAVVTMPWWQQPFNPALPGPYDSASGLSSPQARILLARDGPNEVSQASRYAPLIQYLARFANPLVVILLVASLVAALTHELADFVIISMMVLLSVTLDFIQEFRAHAAADKLRRLVASRASVVRDGHPTVVAASELVRGDKVLLAAGDLVPADGFVLAADKLFVNQALLTGEAYPVEKAAAIPATPATELHEASNALFGGTTIVSGSGSMLVVETGAATVTGTLGAVLAQTSPKTSFETALGRFGMLIMRLTITLTLFVLLVNVFFERPLIESFLFAVALAVGLTPELLPMVVSVTLARGAVRMAARQTIVKRMTAIQELGSMDVLCTDKTGTLTEASMRLAQHVDALGQSSERVLELAYLNSIFETGLKSPLDEAILAHAQLDASAWTKVDELPFDFERRRISVLVDNGQARWLVVKGAAEEIAGLCTHYEAGQAGELALDPTASGAIRGRYQALEEAGMRVLGIGWRELPRDHVRAAAADESGLVLAGFAAFLDPPKRSATAALAALQQIGVGIKIVTGDSEGVTRHLCKELGLPISGVVHGSDLARMDDPALGVAAARANLFCRIDPMQKNRIILALKARGHVVGYLGDGINDAPSLHSADVGISVDTAADVARAAADMILLAPDLGVLHAGVLEGRRTFGNIMKYIMMVTSSNFGNMLSMALASLFLPFLPMLPIQILLNNGLYDLSELPIPLDDVDPQEMQRPRQLDLTLIRNFMLIIGAVSSLFDLLTFYILLVVLQADEKFFQTGWFVESLCTQVLVIFIIRTRGNPLTSRVHPLLAATSIAVVMSALLLPATVLGAQFGLVPLPLAFYLLLGSVLLAYLLVVELVKHRYYSWFNGGP